MIIIWSHPYGYVGLTGLILFIGLIVLLGTSENYKVVQKIHADILI